MMRDSLAECRLTKRLEFWPSQTSGPMKLDPLKHSLLLTNRSQRRSSTLLYMVLHRPATRPAPTRQESFTLQTKIVQSVVAALRLWFDWFCLVWWESPLFSFWLIM